MLEHLFGSKTRVKLLKLFFQSPEKTFFVRELARELETQINAVRRELQLLMDSGLILEAEDLSRKDMHKAGSALRKYYRLNLDAQLYPELFALIMKSQVVDEQQFLQTIEQKGGDIQIMLLTGLFVGDYGAPSDLLIVGELKDHVIARLIEDYEKESGRSIRYTLMNTDEFTDRRHIMDKFLFSLFEGKNVKLVNKLEI